MVCAQAWQRHSQSGNSSSRHTRTNRRLAAEGRHNTGSSTAQPQRRTSHQHRLVIHARRQMPGALPAAACMSAHYLHMHVSHHVTLPVISARHYRSPFATLWFLSTAFHHLATSHKDVTPPTLPAPPTLPPIPTHVYRPAHALHFRQYFIGCIHTVCVCVCHRMQVVVRSVLQALIPLLQAQALPPKRLASLARAINTLASASSATNTRQRGSTGYLTASPAQQQDTRSTDGASTQAAATAAADGAVPVAVIAALPPGFAAAYEVAVSNALPVTSPEAYCYLLRAVSLDRCKRLLRASKHLSPHLAARAAQLAPLMSAEQVSITISCGAQLVWDPAQPWLATLLHRLTGLGEELTADNACAVLSALGKIRTGVPTAVQALLLDRVGKVLVQVGKVGEPGG